MSNSEIFQNPKSRMILPFMGGFYDAFAQPLAWVGFRALIGLMLVYESLGKVEAPLDVERVIDLGSSVSGLAHRLQPRAQLFRRSSEQISAGVCERQSHLAIMIALAA